MKTFEEIKKIINLNKPKLKQDFGVKSMGIFGSYVRGEASKESDLDILIELERPMGFVRFMKMEKYISSLLEVKVDLVTKKALKPYIGKVILEEVIYV